MNLDRISRLLSLLQKLQAGQGANADKLAEACGVSRRTVFRDLETLRAAGVPLKYDKDGQRYSIASDFFLPPTNFTPGEALAIVCVAKQMGVQVDTPFFGPAQSAALKLESSLPASQRNYVQTLQRAISLKINAPQSPNGDGAVYEQLVDSLAQRRVVRIRYDSLTEWKFIKTSLRIYHLLFSRNAWYAIGRSSLHREVRTFNVSRIHDLSIQKQRYVVPRKFSLEDYLGNAWHLIPQPGADAHVVVLFSPLVAKNVAGVSWHKSQRLVHRSDDSLEFHADVSGLNEIVWWILGYGDQAEVLRPARLRRLVQQRAQSLLQRYQGEAPGRRR